jgi:hypothetical protein
LPNGSPDRALYNAIPILAFAQAAGDHAPGAGVVQGTVKDASGSTIAGAVVTLETAVSTGERSAITDPAGSFRFYLDWAEFQLSADAHMGSTAASFFRGFRWYSTRRSIGQYSMNCAIGDEIIDP